jgi:membrane protein implicated in regulation of membrane protease activity
MNWESFYLTCFLVGLLLTVVSFVFGGHFHLPVHVSLPHGWHLPHIGIRHGSHDQGSPLSLTTLLMFLTWFGGTGYVMSHYHNTTAVVALFCSAAVGFLGGALMNVFTMRVFVANEHPLREEDFEMVGVLGHLSIPIRETGTGELIYSQQGTRRSCGARSDEGIAIDRGTEVVVMRYDKGIAYVRRWTDLHLEA